MKYIIAVDKQPRTNPSSSRRETTIDIEELRRKGDVHDDFKIEKGIAKVYRRVGLTKYHVTYILDNEVIEELGKLKIPLFKGTNYIYVKDEYNNQMCAEYVIKNDFTDAYVTNLEMSSAIEQNAKQILLNVTQILEGYSDTETTKAMINLKADEIREEVSRDYATQDALEQEKSERTQTANSIVETVSETYSTKTETNQAKTEAINSANTSTDNKLKNYSTTVQMNSAITQKADSIINSVSATYATKTALENTSKTLTASIELKINKKDLVSELNASADVINLKSNRLTIDSTYFKLTKEGKITCSNADITGKITATSGKIAGFTIVKNTLKGQQVGMCGLDGEEWAFWAGANNGTDAPFSVGHNGKVYMSNAIISGGTITLTGNNAYSIEVYDNSKATMALLGGEGLHIEEVAMSDIPSQIQTEIYNGKAALHIIDRNLSASTTVAGEGITTPRITQTSEEKYKENIKRFYENTKTKTSKLFNRKAIDILKDGDIYKYNFKGDTAKRIGLVIGEGYNCPEEVISTIKRKKIYKNSKGILVESDEYETVQGIDLYSMISICWQAIQEILEKLEDK